ncbi:MAG: imidazoleglycerol-phosphate dehydratase HisB [Campylobacteraceae bacterium]|nr:imidazoleglycerol-phosphate dehydratase HisB [Campylobacteraceae bacterium]
MIKKERTTKETSIVLELRVRGEGKAEINTGIGFFDHMLDALSRHSGMDINLKCKGDLHVDYHHSVEDVGIVLGEALKEALFPVGAIERYGNARVVMDEASVACDLDISNRPFLVYELNIQDKIGDFDTELVEEFFRALVFNAGLSVHLIEARGKNRHHIVEAAFKAFAVALRRALAPSTQKGIPSTKGVL